MFITLDEVINGWVVKIQDNYEVKSNEFVETKREALSRIESYINKAQIHELNLLIEGSRRQ